MLLLLPLDLLLQQLHLSAYDVRTDTCKCVGLVRQYNFLAATNLWEPGQAVFFLLVVVYSCTKMTLTSTSIDRATMILPSSSTYTWLFSIVVQGWYLSALPFNSRARVLPVSFIIDKARITPASFTAINYKEWLLIQVFWGQSIRDAFSKSKALTM